MSRELLLIIFGIIMAVIIINKSYYIFNKTYMAYALEMAKKYVVQVMNEAADGVELEKDYFITEKNSDNEIKLVRYDTNKATYLVNEITNNIQNKLDMDNYIIGYFPMGIIFKNNLMRNLGPKIMVKIDVIDNILTEIKTNLKPYGINNTLLEVSLNMRASIRVILPLESDEIKIENNVPISIYIVSGKVPDGYIGTYK